MPLEPDDLHISPGQENLNRQLEALQHYVSGLQQREHAKAAAQPPPAPEARSSRRWLLLTGLLIVLALVGGVFVGAVAWSDDRPTGAGVQGSIPATAAPVASLACKTAVDRANTMLAIAVKPHRELVEYSRIMTDPSSRELPGRELVDKSVPALRAGTSESVRFTQALVARQR